MKRHASAIWEGGLKDGKGALSTQSGVLDNSQYGFSSRFENGIGTNPEELIGAALSGCFTMAASGQLAEAGMQPQRLQTKATVSFDKTDAGFTITAIHLELTGKVSGGDRAAFEAAVQRAKETCPVSRVLKADITLDAKLET